VATNVGFSVEVTRPRTGKGVGKWHKLVDALPEEDVPTASRILKALSLTADPVARSLAMAPFDDEPDDDDFDAGLSEARREAQEGRLLSHDEIKKELGLT
jgi:hypothetical protein